MCIYYKFSVELLLCRYRTNKNAAGCIASIESAANIIDVISISRIRLCTPFANGERDECTYIQIIKRLRKSISYIKAESL